VEKAHGRIADYPNYKREQMLLGVLEGAVEKARSATWVWVSISIIKG